MTARVFSPTPRAPDSTVCTFFVAGEPVPQPRGRAVRRGNHVQIVSNPAGHPIVDWKASLKHEADIAMHGKELIDKIPLRLELIFQMPRPEALTKPKWREKFVLVSNGKDCDNLAKAVQDALNKVVWKDDRIISTLLVRKQYTLPNQRPGVQVGVFYDDPEELPFWP